MGLQHAATRRVLVEAVPEYPIVEPRPYPSMVREFPANSRNYPWFGQFIPLGTTEFVYAATRRVLVAATLPLTPPAGAAIATDFGIVGDGTDERAAMQAMINATGVGDVLWFPDPPVRYYFGQAPGQSYGLAGRTGLDIRGVGDATYFYTPATYPIQFFSGDSGITLKNFRLQGTYLTNQYGVVFSGNVSQVLIDGLTVHDMLFAGLYSSAALTEALVKNTTLHDNGFVGVQLKDGSGQVRFEDCLSHNCMDPMYPPHPYYISGATGLIEFIRCEGHTVASRPNGYGGVQLTNCSNVYLEDCNMHHNRPVGANDGYGYIFDGATNAELVRCIGAKDGYTGPCLDNYYTFYEIGGPTVTYEDCVGTKRVYG